MIGFVLVYIFGIFIIFFDMFREVNQLSEEMGKEIEFVVILQV